jgi:hypothetical protein
LNDDVALEVDDAKVDDGPTSSTTKPSISDDVVIEKCDTVADDPVNDQLNIITEKCNVVHVAAEGLDIDKSSASLSAQENVVSNCAKFKTNSSPNILTSTFYRINNSQKGMVLDAMGRKTSSDWLNSLGGVYKNRGVYKTRPPREQFKLRTTQHLKEVNSTGGTFKRRPPRGEWKGSLRSRGLDAITHEWRSAYQRRRRSSQLKGEEEALILCEPITTRSLCCGFSGGVRPDVRPE